jgi:RND family efflux transporter MFP subunit
MNQVWANRASILGVIVILLALGACDRAEDKTADTVQQQAPVLQRVSTLIAEERLFQPGFEFPATIEAVETASIRSQIAATVVAKYSTPGALVKKGDLLVELDASEFIAAHAAAESELQEAEANAGQATSTLERAKTLKPKGHISAQEYDQIKANADVAKARIARSKAALIRAELDLKYTKIYAPFDGKISAAHFTVGDFVMPSSPVQPQPLFELVNLDPIYAISNLDVKVYDNFILKRLELKQKGVEIPPVELGIKLPNGVLYPYRGIFENWDNRAAESSGSIAARILFENPDGLLLPGHKVTLVGQVTDKIERIMIPQRSVSMDQQGHYVFTVQDQIVARKNVTVGIKDGADWAIIQGLEEGDQVIVEGVQKVRPGDKVDISQASL